MQNYKVMKTLLVFNSRLRSGDKNRVKEHKNVRGIIKFSMGLKIMWHYCVA